MAIELIDKIKQKNGGTFKLVDSEDIAFGEHSLTEEIDSVKTQLSETNNNVVGVSVKNFGAVGDGVTDDTQAIINAINSNHEIITMDSKNEILLSSNKEKIILNDFNYHFFRLVSGQNHILINSDITITIKFRVPRKVGFV